MEIVSLLFNLIDERGRIKTYAHQYCVCPEDLQFSLIAKPYILDKLIKRILRGWPFTKWRDHTTINIFLFYAKGSRVQIPHFSLFYD